MKAPTPTPPILINNGRYQLSRQLGRGQMGTVYLATDELLHRDVAIKFLAADQLPNSEASVRFTREARAVAQLSHPNIMLVYDIGQQDGWDYLILEYIDGRTLTTLITNHPEGLPYTQALPFIHQLLSGLQHAHTQEIIHRDLKPSNIMLTAANQVKITDFGLAAVSDDTAITQAGSIVGTLRYIAPELLAGQPATAASDLYSLGAIIYELLTGRPPHDQPQMPTLMWHIAHEPIVPPRTHQAAIPDALEEIILRLLAKHPAERYASAAAVLDDLAKFDTAQTTTTSSTRLLVEQLTQKPLSTTSAHLLEQALAADQTTLLETERRRLAQRLQNQIIEPLNLLLSQTNVYQQTLTQTPQIRTAFSILTTLIRQAIQQSRDLETELHPVILESLGLEPALETLTNQLIRTHGVHIALQLARLEERLPAALELILFRATQELIEQALEHGRASHITIQLFQTADTLHYQLTDNGGQNRPPLPPTTAAQFGKISGELTGRFDPAAGYRWQITIPRQPTIDLTPREQEIIKLLVEGLSNKEIATRLSVTPRTVNFHLNNLYSKLGVNSRTEAAVIALQKGWVTT